MEKIEITFSKTTGTAKVETSGFAGKSCTDATKFLASLGTVSGPVKFKGEYYEEDKERAGVRKTLYNE